MVLRLSLFLSITVNLALGGIWLWRNTTAVPVAAQPTATTTTSAPRVPAPAATTPLSPFIFSPTERLDPAADDATYVARLRSAGFPPNAIRTLLTSRIEQRYAGRFRQLQQEAAAFPYWQRSSWDNRPFEGDRRKPERALRREIQAEIAPLLGPDAGMSAGEYARRESECGPLAPALIRQIDALNGDYADLSAQVQEQAQGVMLDADREALRLLERERRADLAALLTPAQLLEYDMRGSPSARSVRNKLTYFEPTETEYRTLVALQLDFDQRYDPGESSSATEQAARRAAEQELAGKFEAALGPQRYADYLIATDASFGAHRDFATAQGLAPTVARDLIALKRATNQRADTIRRQPTQAREQLATALADLARETSAQLAATLSPQAYAAYTKTSASQWLTRLNPPARASPVPSRP